ncbi:hypothetical protein J4464_05550 [Candidatus Woesearchaeota archaeon]|nr:hypothetical protein [Candidatus Woesearchaeota archaeon]
MNSSAAYASLPIYMREHQGSIDDVCMFGLVGHAHGVLPFVITRHRMFNGMMHMYENHRWHQRKGVMVERTGETLCLTLTPARPPLHIATELGRLFGSAFMDQAGLAISAKAKPAMELFRVGQGRYEGAWKLNGSSYRVALIENPNYKE